jgi:hypothetical protein
MASHQIEEKPQLQDRVNEAPGQQIVVDKEGNTITLDYAGAHSKIDATEIKLVKKLDRWIMPTLWLMYWLNFLDRNAIALARSVAF